MDERGPTRYAEKPRSHDLPVSQICALMVLSSIASVLVANSTPIVDLESRLNSLRVNLDRTVQMERLNIAKTAATKVLWTHGFCRQSYDLVSTVKESTSSEARYTHDFPTPESPMRTTCQGVRLTSLFWCFPANTDLEEKVKVAAFGHGYRIGRGEMRSKINYAK